MCIVSVVTLHSTILCFLFSGVGEQLPDHRFYDLEVLDLSKDVSFILLLPPRDLVCSVNSQSSNTAGKITDYPLHFITQIVQTYVYVTK